ncbi:surface-adhesin E family protein [Stenotrophomonas indicatrix]|uniref:surface-adhesin E family protein n=1 Tax=Stenotrophomonas indicatrix TaxID=2045451 RepID=UPI0028AA57F4|nr:surface-adhesin E family protein [Stenotrophomonas indicatrix]
MIAVLLTLALSTSATTDRWVEVGATVVGGSVYVDKSTVVKSEDGTTVWVKFVGGGERVLGSPLAAEAMARVSFSCSHMTYSVHDVIRRDGAGRPLPPQATDKVDDRTVVPDTIYEALWNATCR